MAPEDAGTAAQGSTGTADDGTGDAVAAAAAAQNAPSPDDIAAAEKRAAADKIVADKAAEAAGDKGKGAGASASSTEGAGTGEGDGQPAGSPDKFALELPQGFEDQQQAFEEMARRQGLTNDQAQAVLEALPEQYQEQSDRFLEEIRADDEIGGEKLERAQINARLVIDKYLPADTEEGKALRRGLDITGYGNWKPLVKLFSRIGATIAEDQPAGEGLRTPASGEKSVEDVLYGGD